MLNWTRSLFVTVVTAILITGTSFLLPQASHAQDTYAVPQTADVTLAWDANDPVPDGYNIYQRAEGGAYDYSQPVWTGSATSGTVYNLAGETTYYFVVRAFEGSLQSADSEEVSYTTPAAETTNYTITAAADANGSVTPSGAVTVTDGGSQAFSITADSGYHIADVTVDGVSQGAIAAYTFSQVTADHTLSASFAVDAPVTYSITASAGTGGSVSPSGSISVVPGADQTFTISANSGYHVANVTVDGTSKGAISSYTFNNVAANHTIFATFAVDAPTTYSISASAGTGGSISPAGSISVVQGAGQAFAIAADAGYHVANVIVDGVSKGAVSSYTFTDVQANHTISASFAADTFAISASCGSNGSITPAGVTTVSSGASQAYTITADDGYTIVDVQVDGQSVGGVSSYTFSDVTCTHSISATFGTAGTVAIQLEAEDGDIYWPMEIGDDDAASAGGFIWTAEGTARTASKPSYWRGYAEYTFNVPESGEYVIWGRELSTGASSDSFFVSVDGQDAITWHTQVSENGEWIWDVVSVRSYSDPRDTSNPERFYLNAGEHTLRISLREDGTKLDKLLITNQEDLSEGDGGDDALEKMEFGDVQIDHQWQRVAFQKTFMNPVVVAGPLSNNGGQPAVVRIRNVDPTGFEIRVQEWDYLDGDHAVETVSYLVMEAGSYTLDDGTRIEAVNVDSFSAPNFKAVTFNQAFNTVPVVMSSVTSFNDSAAVTDRMRTITAEGFMCRMQEQEANSQDHGAESLSYIAWEPSTGTLAGTTYVIGKTGDEITSGFSTITFAAGFAAVPAMLMDMQSTDGGDTANTRYCNPTGQSVDLKVAEEQSRDTETNHTSEVVGYMLFSR